MKKILMLTVLLAVAMLSPAFALEADYLQLSVNFPLVSNTVASAPTSVVAFKAPANITLKSVYVTDTGGIAASSTAYLTFVVKDDGTTIQSRATTTALTAMTPAAFTLATAANVHKIAKDSIVTVAITKTGDGAAQTTPVVQLNYVIGW